MTTLLYRPVGLKEMELIADSAFRAFPPRLEWQPIFYPVLNEAYAVQIITQWNVNDANSGYCGFVTQFTINTNFLKQYVQQNVGTAMHNEYWIPAEDLNKMNDNIVGPIEVTQFHKGEQFTPSQNKKIQYIIQQLTTHGRV